MTPQALDERVDSLERRVTSLEEIPGRVDALSTQISQLRDEVRTESSAIRSESEAIRGEFEAIRGGPRTPDTPSLMSLQREMRDEFASVRHLVRETSEQTMAQMRVLYENMIDRIKTLGEGDRPPDASS